MTWNAGSARVCFSSSPPRVVCAARERLLLQLTGASERLRRRATCRLLLGGELRGKRRRTVRTGAGIKSCRAGGHVYREGRIRSECAGDGRCEFNREEKTHEPEAAGERPYDAHRVLSRPRHTPCCRAGACNRWMRSAPGQDGRRHTTLDFCGSGVRSEGSARSPGRSQAAEADAKGGVGTRILEVGRQFIRLGAGTLGEEAPWFCLGAGSLGQETSRLGLGARALAVASRPRSS